VPQHLPQATCTGVGKHRGRQSHAHVSKVLSRQGIGAAKQERRPGISMECCCNGRSLTVSDFLSPGAHKTQPAIKLLPTHTVSSAGGLTLRCPAASKHNIPPPPTHTPAGTQLRPPAQPLYCGARPVWGCRRAKQSLVGAGPQAGAGSEAP
jgi:hypothetical protein